ncbi:MAG: macro domain-containing protein [Chitinophagales bacterium]
MGVSLLKGDITEIDAEALVNAANNHLWMGSGVAGAIKSKGGISIQEEAVKKGPIPVGEAAVTSAGNLKARYIIHAAVMGQDLRTDYEKIRTATVNALLRAKELGINSIAFPALGTGVGGFPPAQAALAMKEAMDAASVDDMKIIMVLFDDRTYREYELVFEK